MTPDTDELLLREIEGLVAGARAAFLTERWGEAAMNIGFAMQDCARLVELLHDRVDSLADPSFLGG